jgi:hypothetical protein
LRGPYCFSVMAQGTHAKTHGAERGLSRFEGFSDAVFAIALTLLIVEIKVPGSPDGPHDYTDLARAMAEQWREHLALVLCYVVLGAYWLQHHYSGRIYAKSDHWFSAINLLFLLAIVAIPYPIRVWCFHLGSRFEPVGSVTARRDRLFPLLGVSGCSGRVTFSDERARRRRASASPLADFSVIRVRDDVRDLSPARWEGCGYWGYGHA